MPPRVPPLRGTVEDTGRTCWNPSAIHPITGQEVEGFLLAPPLPGAVLPLAMLQP